MAKRIVNGAEVNCELSYEEPWTVALITVPSFSDSLRIQIDLDKDYPMNTENDPNNVAFARRLVALIKEGFFENFSESELSLADIEKW